MIDLKNLFRKTSQSVVKISLALRALIGTLATASYIQERPNLAFWLLVAGAIVDFLLQTLPENIKAKDGTKTLFILVWLIAATALLSGCKVLRPATESSLVDTTTTTYKKVDVAIKGAKVLQRINYDSLFGIWLAKYKQYQIDSSKSVKEGKPLPARPWLSKQTITDVQTKAQLTYWIDAFGKLQVGCESKDQTIKMLVAETNRLRSEKQKVIAVDYKTPTWNRVFISVLATLLLISLIINLILFKR